MSIQKLGIDFRPATTDDVNFILNSWMKSNRSNYIKTIENPNMYYKTLEPFVKEMIGRGTLVAYNVSKPDQIFGYICGEWWESALILHYCYIKGTYKGFGIAKYLYDKVADGKSLVIITNMTKSWDKIMRKHDLSCIYNPWIIYSLKELNTRPISGYKGVISL